MALAAKMAATQVTKSGSGRWVGCSSDHPDAKPISHLDSVYGPPAWLDEFTHVRFDPLAQGQEFIKLTAVSFKGDENDPNRQWAMASPSGHLELHIANPDAFGYIDQGYEYRVTIERIRKRPSLSEYRERPTKSAVELDDYPTSRGPVESSGSPTLVIESPPGVFYVRTSDPDLYLRWDQWDDALLEEQVPGFLGRNPVPAKNP